VKLGIDVHGNITRLDNALDGMEKRLERAGSDLENIQKQFETAKVEVKKPFAQEKELRTKTARLNELNALLDVDKRDNELVGGEQSDVGDDAPDRQHSSRDER
jgi:predicted  nucleic acid-binding Zn-ribbon protein